MAQIAVDSKGNKLRWDESKKEWIPVETAVNEKGTKLEYDGAKWSPVYGKPPAVPAADKIVAAKPKDERKWQMVGGMEVPKTTEGLRSFGDVAKGFGSALSGLAAFPVSTAVSAGLQAPGAGKITLPPDMAEGAGNMAGGAMSVKANTPGSQELAASLGTPFYPLNKAVEAMPNAQARTALSVLMLVAPYAKGMVKGFVNGRLKSGQGVTPKEMDVILKKTELPPDIAAKVKSTRLQDPPTPTGDPIADALALDKFNKEQRAADALRPASQGISVTPPSGPTAVGPKVGDIQPVKPANIQPINTNPAKVLAEALKQAPRLLPQQKSMYGKEAGERLRRAEEVGAPISGEAGFKAARGQMKGQMKKVDFEMPKIDPANREALFNMVWDDPYLTMGERFSLVGDPEIGGRSSSGLVGMLDYGKFPAKHEVELMNRVFGNEVSDALIGKMSNKEQLMFWATNLANVPRTMMASFDLSAPLRQGIFLIGRPKQFGKALGAMFQSLKSEEGYNAVIQKIASRPTFKLGRERGLALSEINSALNRTEEQFIGSGIIERAGKKAVEKWPGVRGKAINLIPEGVKASQRAYTGFLNKLRADTFDSLVNKAQDLGLFTDKQSGITDIFGVNEKLSSDIARYVNIASGRGNLGKLAQEHANLTNAVFFSPRLMSARLALFDPRTYFDISAVPRKVLGGKKYPLTEIEIMGKESAPKVSKFVRREAIKDAGNFFIFYTTTAMLAKFVLNQELGADPRSSDFTKIVSGNTSVDLSGGIGSYARTAAQLSQQLFEKLGIIDESYLVSSSSGKKTKMGGGFNEVSFGDTIVRFLSQKENPIVSFFSGVAFQRDETGKPLNVVNEVKERIIPIIAQDLVDLYKDDPDAFKVSVMGLLTLFGAGVQTYPPKKDKSFVDQGTKTRQDMITDKPSGDAVVDELKAQGVKAVLGTKKVDGLPVPEADIAQVLKDAGPEIRKRVEFYMKNPAYAKATPEQKKKWLQKAVNAGWTYYKNKRKAEAR